MQLIHTHKMVHMDRCEDIDSQNFFYLVKQIFRRVLGDFHTCILPTGTDDFRHLLVCVCPLNVSSKIALMRPWI
eukprot:c31996_g1_i1 orf=84-305(+)